MRSAASGTVASHASAFPVKASSGPNAAGSNYVTSAALASGDFIGSFQPSTTPIKASMGSLSSSKIPPLSESFADRGLTMLARSWATTTPTAGLPLDTYKDNIERYRDQYEAGAGVITPSKLNKNSNLRPNSAPQSPSNFRKLPNPVGGRVFMTPQKPPPGRGNASSPARGTFTTSSRNLLP